MSAGRVFGGVPALIAGFFVLIMVFLNADAAGAGGNIMIAWVINLFLGVLALLSGFLGIGSKSGGGIALVAALIAILLGVLSVTVVDLQVMFAQYSLFATHMSIGAWYGITLEAILLLFGGIFMAASGPN